MYAASAYQLYGAAKQVDGHQDWGALAIAFVVSTITASIAVKRLLGYIKSHRYTAFAIYRILMGAALLATAAVSRII